MSENVDGRILTSGLTRRFGPRLALAPTDLALGPGGITGLLGQNGSGKSTLLRCAIGLVRADAGTARIDGAPLAGDGTAVRRRVAYAPGELHLYGEMRAREHLAWFVRGRRAPRVATDAALAIATRLGLPLRARVRSFSHGMKRQLVVAAALAPDVRVRLLDEPTEGLDPVKRLAVLELLREDAARGTTILLSSHHLGEVDRICDRLVFLHEGRKLAEEDAADLRRRAQGFVHLTFAGPPPAGLAHEIERLSATLVRVEGVRVSVRLDRPDPRPFLAQLASSSLPPPVAIEHGRPSIADLYRDVYGVEGV